MGRLRAESVDTPMKARFPEPSDPVTVVVASSMEEGDARRRLRPQLGYITQPSYQHLSGADKVGTVHGMLDMIRQYHGSCGYRYIYIGCGDHSNNAH